MVKAGLIVAILAVCSTLYGECLGAATMNCQRPPQLVDPAQCCRDGGRDQITENCAKRMGITGQPSDPQPTVETATCLAECILTESRYMQQPGKLHMDTIRSDLQAKFANDSLYVQTMAESFERCEPNAQRKLAAFGQQAGSRGGGNGGGISGVGGVAGGVGGGAGGARMQMQRGCSPFSSLVLGCTYMEYFKNCPADRWTENADCALAKQFVTQCALGA